MKVAVVGSGVSGLVAAWTLAKAGVEVTVYERDAHIGGHACSTYVESKIPVDVGFMVFNKVTYPNLVAFFEELGVEIEPSDMSFSVSLNNGSGCEWGSTSLAGLFAQKRNALNPYFFQMLREMVIFQSDVLRYLEQAEGGDGTVDLEETLGQFLSARGYSHKFRTCYLVPVCASIWSCGAEGVLGCCAYAVLSFLRNHHMLQIFGRPQWLTVKGRSQAYVSKVVEAVKARGGSFRTGCAITAVHTTGDASSPSGVRVDDAGGASEHYDACVLAAHAPDTLALLGDAATPAECSILGSFQYSQSEIYLHRDERLMPKRRAAWSAWNFRGSSSSSGKVIVTYWLNALQNLGDTGAAVLVTLNPEVTPAHVVRQWTTSHPVPSPAAAAAARRMHSIQGQRKLWFCGAYEGKRYGFHEDGFKAGAGAARALLGEAYVALPNERHMVATWSQAGARVAVLAFLKGFVQQGELTIHEAGGTVIRMGSAPPAVAAAGGGKAGGARPQPSWPQCLLLVQSPDFYWKVATRSDLGLADAYIDGDFRCHGGSDGLLAFLLLLVANRDRGKKPGQAPPKPRGWWRPPLMTAVLGSAADYVRHLLRYNSLTNARRNIANHYDLSNEMFSLFLDESMTYSCAIFKEEGEPLKDAQMRKLHLLIKKARIEAHHHVLEIGFGWGSLAMEMVRLTGCRYTGITLSKQQLALAQQRVNAAGLQDKIEFKMCDYRQLPGIGRYDRIVSCEMLEAVGHEFYGSFYHHCDRLLAMDGLLVLQVITTPHARYEEYRRSSDFIKEYIFPGIEHVENIGPHYAPTLLRWRDNFLAKSGEVMRMGFSAKFVRMWDYYFVYCAAGFQSCTLGDIQVVYTRAGNGGTLGDPYKLS
eukprot:jgi/Mesen1/7615/ME000397S06675